MQLTPASTNTDSLSSESRARHRFEAASASYQTGSVEWRRICGERVVTFADPHPTDVILDVGCGTGTHVCHLATQAAFVVGIDISAHQIHRCRQAAKRLGLENTAFGVGSFLRPQSDALLRHMNVSTVISNYALHHLALEEKREAIHLLFRLMRPTLTRIVIGDLMLFGSPSRHLSEYKVAGYNPAVDQPSTIEELRGCFSELPFTIQVHQLHPLVGVIVATRFGTDGTSPLDVFDHARTDDPGPTVLP